MKKEDYAQKKDLTFYFLAYAVVYQKYTKTKLISKNVLKDIFTKLIVTNTVQTHALQLH